MQDTARLCKEQEVIFGEFAGRSLIDLIARGELEVPIAGVFALDDVRDAFRQVELRHTRGKLVLRP